MKTGSSPLPVLALVAALTPAAALARPKVDRRGGQAAGWLGASACLPSKAPCARDAADVADPGRTRLSFGGGAELGFRWRHVFLGAAYDLGFLRPDYEIVNAPSYKRAYQHSVFAVVRPILPVWRLDLGVDLGPGFSRQTFVRQDGTKEFSQGFAFKLGPNVSLFVTRRFFLGARMSFILNAHGKACADDGNTRVCSSIGADDRAGVHQLLFGIHLGGTFL